MINIRDEKTGLIYKINLQHVKMLEFTRGNVRIIYKDSRVPDIKIKAKQITFD